MRYLFANDLWNNGNPMTLDFPFDENSLKQVLFEVFMRKDYQEGLDYIQKIDKPIVVDLGAYVGITSLFFLQKDGVKMYAVEAHPETYMSLVKNVKDLNVVPIHFAVGHDDRERRIYQGKDTIGMTLYASEKTDQIQIPVPSIAIDTLFEKYNIKHVDVLKIDVENAEFEIFLSEGFDKVKDKIDFIIGEAHNDILPYQSVKSILEEKGFRCGYLPIDNIEASYKITVGDKIHKVVSHYQSMFCAQRL